MFFISFGYKRSLSMNPHVSGGATASPVDALPVLSLGPAEWRSPNHGWTLQIPFLLTTKSEQIIYVRCERVHSKVY